MPNPDPIAVLVGVVAVVAVLVVLVALTAVRRRHERDFDVHPLPADRVEPYRQRLNELETLFVSQPRRAVADARQLVDDMLAQMGYPARLGRDDRVRDIASANRGHAKLYRTAVAVDDRSTTEEMRQAMEHLLTIGRELLGESDRGAPAAASETPASETAAAETPTDTPEAAADEPRPVGRPVGESSGDRRFAG